MKNKDGRFVMNSSTNSFQYDYFIQSEKIHGLNVKNIKIGIKIKYKSNIHMRSLHMYIIGEYSLYMYEM